MTTASVKLPWAKANRSGFSQNDFTGQREITVTWQSVVDADRATVLAELNAVTHTTELIIDSGKITYSGTWRNAGSGWDSRSERYYMVLREGWAGTVLTGSAPNDECMVQTGSDSRSDSRAYVFLWRNIASSAVNACVAALRSAGSFANPPVQGEAKTGTYVITNIVPAQQEDGSYWITAETVKVAAVAALSDLQALTAIREKIHDVENPFGLEGGYTSHIGRKPTDSITLTYRALSTGSKSVLEALTDSQLLDLLPDADKLLFETVKARIAEDESNTLKLVVAYQYVPLATTITAETARLVGITRKNQSNKIIIQISWPRINPASIDTIMATALFTRDTVTDPVVEGKTYSGEYLVNTTQAPLTDNDGIRIVQTMTKAGDQTLDITTGKDPDHLVKEFFRWDISATDIAEFMSETGGEAHDPKLYNWGTPEDGVTKNVRIEKNEDESFTLYAVFSDTDGYSHVDLTDTGKLTLGESVYSTNVREYGFNMPVSALQALAAQYSSNTVNVKRTFNISRQTEHVFDFTGEVQTFTSSITPSFTSESNAGVIESTTKGRRLTGEELTAFIAATPFVAGTVEQIDKELNELGSTDAVKKTKVFGEVATTLAESVKDAGKTVSSEKKVNKAVEYTAGTPSAGTVEVITQEKDPVTGLVNGEKKTTVFSEVATDSHVSRKNAGVEETTASKENSTTGYTAGTPPAGTTVVVEQKKDPVTGLINASQKTVVAADLESNDGEQSLTGTSATVKHTAAAAAAAVEVSAAQNVQTVVQNVKLEHGKFQTAKETKTAVPWSMGSASVVEDDGVVETKKQIYKNQTSAPTAGSGERIALGDNSLGGYNYEKIIQALKEGQEAKYTHNSSTVDFDSRSTPIRVPTYTTSTDSGEPKVINGYNYFTMNHWRSRTITQTIVRTYSLTHPNQSSVTSASAGATEGEGTSYSKNTVKVADGLWATEEKTLTTGAYGAINSSTTWLYWAEVTTGTQGGE